MVEEGADKRKYSSQPWEAEVDSVGDETVAPFVGIGLDKLAGLDFGDALLLRPSTHSETTYGVGSVVDSPQSEQAAAEPKEGGAE